MAIAAAVVAAARAAESGLPTGHVAHSAAWPGWDEGCGKLALDSASKTGGIAGRACLMTRTPEPQRGVALVLTLIFAILLYVLIAELVVSGRMVRLTGENDALLARMRNHMDYTLFEVQEQLLEDLAGAAAAEESGSGAGAAPPATGVPGMGTGAGAGGEEQQTDPAAGVDSSRDAWFQPSAHADNDLTTYVWVEDENRKFNILALFSPEEEFAKQSRERLVRLIDVLREDTEYDVSASDAERIVRELEEWVKRQGSDMVPRAPLKTEDEKDRDLVLPLHLDEMLMLPSVTEDLYQDKVLDGRVILGLESVLTVWTSLAPDPGDPRKMEQQRLNDQARGGTAGGSQSGTQPQQGQQSGQGAQQGATGQQNRTTGANANTPPPQPEGEGIRINLNTAPGPVLRCLFDPGKVPDSVIEAILRYRNEVDEEAMAKQEEETGETSYDYGELQLGEDVQRRFFTAVADLEKVPEFANLPDPELKAEFQRLCTTKSDVFSIHMAAMFRRSEENRVFVLRRSRSVVQRRDDGDSGVLYPLVLQEERHGLRVVPVDLQEEVIDLRNTYQAMDQFAQEERAWNPFLIDFYLPQHQRDEFYLKR